MSQPPAPFSSRPAADPVFQMRALSAALMTMVGLFGLFGGIAAAVTSSVQRGIYPVAAAIAIAVIALWLAVTSMTRARRVGSSRPRGAVFAIVLGIIGILIGGYMLLDFAVAWPLWTQFSHCNAGANTITAQNACLQQMMNSVHGQEAKLMLGTKS